MDLVELLVAHLGLIVFTLVSVALLAYLAYSMLHPERL